MHFDGGSLQFLAVSDDQLDVSDTRPNFFPFSTVGRKLETYPAMRVYWKHDLTSNISVLYCLVIVVLAESLMVLHSRHVSSSKRPVKTMETFYATYDLGSIILYIPRLTPINQRVSIAKSKQGKGKDTSHDGKGGMVFFAYLWQYIFLGLHQKPYMLRRDSQE
jgi:hypothetical protein